MEMLKAGITLLLVWSLAGCSRTSDPWDEYRQVLASGRSKIPWVGFVEKCFPRENMDHFITHYGFDGDPKDWNTIVYFNDRYKLQIVQSVKIDYRRRKITGVAGEMRFVVSEISRFDPASRTASYGEQARGGPVEWKKFEDSGGKLSALPLKIVGDRPLKDFHLYREMWGKDIVR